MLIQNKWTHFSSPHSDSIKKIMNALKIQKISTGYKIFMPHFVFLLPYFRFLPAG